MTDLAAWSKRKTESDSLQGSSHLHENSHQDLEGLGYKEAVQPNTCRMLERTKKFQLISWAVAYAIQVLAGWCVGEQLPDKYKIIYSRESPWDWQLPSKSRAAWDNCVSTDDSFAFGTKLIRAYTVTTVTGSSVASRSQ